jgi:hypothetical protein
LACGKNQKVLAPMKQAEQNKLQEENAMFEVELEEREEHVQIEQKSSFFRKCICGEAVYRGEDNAGRW